MFRTEISSISANSKIDHSQKLLLLGSCFTENIGKKLNKFKFQTLINPSGIAYNPISIFKNLENIAKQKNYSKSDLFYHNEQYHCFDLHSCFSAKSENEVLSSINQNITEANKYLRNINYCIISLGSAYVYQHIESNQIVANCHKIPNSKFKKSLLTTEQIVLKFENCLEQIQQINPNIEFIFTVSPIRHLKDGMHENNLSKSTLLLAVNELETKYCNVSYFPSYEIMMDDLRDYRFYTDDMLHPNKTAINYIWEKFAESYFSSKTLALNSKIEKVISGLNHKPFNPESEAHKRFLENLKEQIQEIQKDHPIIRFN